MNSDRLPSTLQEAIVYFADPLNCFHYMVARRWPTGEITCPVCGSHHVRFDRKRLVYHCNAKHPRRQFSVKVGTIFEDSPLSLSKWLPCVWMIANMKNGVSSHEMARSLGVTQKTAWFMLHRIRVAIQEAEGGGRLSGSVEVDETYIGGKARNMHPAKRQQVIGDHKGGVVGKVAVMGLLERHSGASHSTVRLKIVKGVRREQLLPQIDANVEPLSTVYTDALPSYEKLGDRSYIHHVIDHAERYAAGQVHVNGLENFWSLLKRGLHGTYVSVAPFHLFRYLDEQAFRFNHRGDATDAERFRLVLDCVTGRRLTYATLIGEAKKTSNN